MSTWQLGKIKVWTLNSVVSDKVVTRKWFWFFCCCYFIIVTGDRLKSGYDANTKYIACLLFPDPHLNPDEYLKFTNCYRELVRNACLGTVKQNWTLIVWQWVNRKHFLSARGNIWNSNAAFYNKTTCLLREGCFNRDLSVITPV